MNIIRRLRSRLTSRTTPRATVCFYNLPSERCTNNFEIAMKSTYRIVSAITLILIGFVSARADDKLVLSRIAFGSCAWQDKPQPIWDAVVGVKPDIYLSLGDNIYGDTEDMAVMKKKYDSSPPSLAGRS